MSLLTRQTQDTDKQTDTATKTQTKHGTETETGTATRTDRDTPAPHLLPTDRPTNRPTDRHARTHGARRHAGTRLEEEALGEAQAVRVTLEGPQQLRLVVGGHVLREREKGTESKRKRAGAREGGRKRERV